MAYCFFVSDLHGKMSRYDSLIQQIKVEKPTYVFMGGDLLPHSHISGPGKVNAEDFASDYLPRKFEKLKQSMGSEYPTIFLILGNDDPRCFETYFQEFEKKNLWKYMHNQVFRDKGFTFFGYSMVPPTPFKLKDWEKYDVSRFVDPGCIEPTGGARTVEPEEDMEYATIQKDLTRLTEKIDLNRAVFLFHSPPYQSNLDRAALDGMMIDHIPLDVHVGSIAIQRFIMEQHPWLTLHGHVHESTRLTGSFLHQYEKTIALNAAHDGPELALVKFDLENPGEAVRILI